MPIYDYECKRCGVFELIMGINETEIPCRCGRTAKRIISASGQFCGNQDAAWIRSVLEVVDKDNKAAHVQKFIANPNRENYRNWMKGEHLRPADHKVHGGPPVYEKPQRNTRTIADELYRKHCERKRISLSS